ncbi:hypothetical protein SAMN04488168_1559 [Bacillus sp. 491mf]|uniref:hypothetical protein n=1 Tax=Bacillus TaxID=1386 RepID=UPI000555D678|nr:MULTISPECIES: hypothetical protein [unclassified Bacillus (in: firmicutes)]SFD59491.1 hypothetical protein SAMN04488168_1559 [Bacillus sp. 491mf]
MKKARFYFIFAFILLTLSCIPMFHILRELWIVTKIENTYEIHEAYIDKDGFESSLDVQELNVNGINLKIEEEKTNKLAPLTIFDAEENVPPGEIVKIHLFINNKEVSIPDEIWLSNRQKGGKYFSWLDVLTVKNKRTDEQQVYFVQRLTNDHDPMKKRKWKIICINQDGTSFEKRFTYAERSNHNLGVELINFSDTGLMSMGHHSDIMGAYPNVFFPLLYPILTCLLGVILLIIAIVLRINKKKIHS